MEIKNYILEFENILTKDEFNIFEKCVKDNIFSFQEAKVYETNETDQAVNTNLRKTETCPFFNLGVESMTVVFWANKLKNIFNNALKDYAKITNTHIDAKVNTIELLKYKVGGFFLQHTDHVTKNPRAISFIYFLNDDYEGGDLIFRLPHGENLKINTKKNKLLVWPSNFLYPHEVMKVTKGIRYSIVAWAN
jgi:predicted 2-oxoglutarate/Fe(II)-dependent dioxygenase YbiX|tara:strand:+ start:1994 stop:2569 length:576 start_codon:yes stop_codon:yes gene_type:complete